MRLIGQLYNFKSTLTTPRKVRFRITSLRKKSELAARDEPLTRVLLANSLAALLRSQFAVVACRRLVLVWGRVAKLFERGFDIFLGWS